MSESMKFKVAAWTVPVWSIGLNILVLSGNPDPTWWTRLWVFWVMLLPSIGGGMIVKSVLDWLDGTSEYDWKGEKKE